MNIRFLMMLVCLISFRSFAQIGPQPGDIYKEFAVNLKIGDNWRVTDPNAKNPGAAAYLPNPVLSIAIGKLDQAVKAEVLMDIWGGHPGTSGKKFRFNNNNWIDIPNVPTLGAGPDCYIKEYNVIVDLPLENIHEGINTFEGTAGGKGICSSLEWGQWGWYVMMVRVYYPRNIAHNTCKIIYPVSGDIIRDDPEIRVQATDSASVSVVQILGNYYGYDENGDGIFKDWHWAYHGPIITGHIGSMGKSPCQYRWNTRYIPNQEEKSISFMARIRDTSGVWFVSDIVDSISLKRPDSLNVKLYKPIAVLHMFSVRTGVTKHSYVRIDTLNQGMEALLYHRTWNGFDESSEKTLIVNGRGYKCYVANHFFALSNVPIAFGDLKSGLNEIAYTSKTTQHGIEVLWPGPAIVVRYVEGGEKVANPIFSPPDGYNFEGTLNPTILSETEGAQVFYTTDGTYPNPSDNLYRGQKIQVYKDMTLKSRAFMPDYYESDVVTAKYTKATSTVTINNDESISFYPNPATTSLHIDLPLE